jgi:hypothetical protein
MIFVSLTVYVFCQSPAATWTNPYFYYHYNTPLALPTPQINSAEKVTASNQNVFSGHDDHSMANTLGSHVVMLSTCLRELKSIQVLPETKFVTSIYIKYFHSNILQVQEPI